MASFKGSSRIILNEGDFDVPFRFELTRCTSNTSNDGLLPATLDCTSVEVFAYSDDSTSFTNILIESYTISNNIINVSLNYPGIGGKYILHFKLHLSNGTTLLNITFDRVFAADKIY